MRLITYPETYETPSKIQLFHPRPNCSKFNISIPLTSMLELPRRESRSEINWVPPLFLCPVSRFGGLGHYIFSGLPFLRGVSQGCCFSQLAVLKAYTVEPHSVGRTPVGWCLLHRLRPSVDGPSWTHWGSMPVLVRNLAP